MRTIIVLWMIACLAGCSYFVSMDELARNIQAQMQQEFNSNQDYQRYRFTVQKVKIVQRQGNQFKAISHLNYQGEAYPVNVKIFKVDGGYRWSIEEDAFAFIDEIEIGEPLTEQNIRYAIFSVNENIEYVPPAKGDYICITSKGKAVKCKTHGQKNYIQKI